MFSVIIIRGDEITISNIYYLSSLEMRSMSTNKFKMIYNNPKEAQNKCYASVELTSKKYRKLQEDLV